MWEKWKKRIERLFFKEVEEEEEVKQEPRNINSLHDQDVHTKITHRYPNRNPFRFPVIPDRPNQRDTNKPSSARKQNTVEQPAYVRKREGKERSPAQQRENPYKQRLSRREADYRDNSRVSDSQKPLKQEAAATKEQPKTVDNKKKKEEKRPFQPTEVPSPIHGFQRREQETIEIPSYLRKQQASSTMNTEAEKDADTSDYSIKEENVIFPDEAEQNGTGALTLADDITDQQEQPVRNEPEHDLLVKGRGDNEDFSEESEQRDVKGQQEQELELSQLEHPNGNQPEYDPSIKYKENGEDLPVESEYDHAEALVDTTDQSEQEPELSPDDYDNVRESEAPGGERVGQDVDSVKEPTKKRNPVHQTGKQRSENRHTNKQKPSDKQKANHSIPFNVMMSANDKRSYRERKRYSNRNQTSDSDKTSIPFYLLNDPVSQNSQDQLWVANQQELLEKTLKYFHVKAKVVRAIQGPSVTRFEVQPEMGVKVSKIKNLSDDLKLNLAAEDIRIEAPIPGKNAVGIEIPNPEAQMVGLQEIFATEAFQKNPSSLTIALGLTIEGSPSVTTIKKMPHGLIAGATGSGKSVCINTILISLIYKASHHDVKFLLIDPKMVELAPFNNIPHLVAPVITDVKAATQALKWAVSEMEKRYEKFVAEGVKDVERYNQKMLKENRPDDKMPFLVIVIDELSDLMMMSPQDVEDAICRIAQKARACGIHLLLATQRPSVDVITGLIKANIPTRIAFSVSSQVDSRTIIDTNGAENLLGKGDMLFVENGAGKSVRLQGAFVSDDEIERVTEYARSIAPTEYAFEQDDLLEQVAVDNDDEDDLLEQAIDFVVEQNSASTSLLQRHFKIGYNRAARLMDTMEMKGIIAQQNGSKPREVLVSASQLSDQ